MTQDSPPHELPPDEPRAEGSPADELTDELTDEPAPPADPRPDSHQQPQAGPRRLRRRVNGSVAGVASGLADYLGIDPVLVRIAFVIITIVGSGGGILLYLAAWLLLPDQSDRDPRPVAFNNNIVSILLGGALLVGALSATLGTVTLGLNGTVVIPLLLVAAGFYLLNQRTEGRQPAPTFASGWQQVPSPLVPRCIHRQGRHRHRQGKHRRLPQCLRPLLPVVPPIGRCRSWTNRRSQLPPNPRSPRSRWQSERW